MRSLLKMDKIFLNLFRICVDCRLINGSEFFWSIYNCIEGIYLCEFRTPFPQERDLFLRILHSIFIEEMNPTFLSVIFSPYKKRKILFIKENQFIVFFFFFFV